MKDPRPPTSAPPRARAFLMTVPAVAAFFLLGYVLGLLSAFSSSTSSSPPPPSLSTDTISTSKKQSTVIEEPPVAAAATLPPRPPPHDLFRFGTQCADPIPHSQILPTILDHVYNNNSPYKDFPSNETSSLLYPATRRLRGWGSRNAVFADLIAAVRPNTIIELGTFLGASALHMASLTRNNFSLPDTVILCVDDFRGWPAFRSKFRRDIPPHHHGDSLLLHQFMLGVAAAGEAERVMPVPFSTGSALAALCEWGVYGDLIEVDAGHDFHSAWADINRAYALLRPGGVMFGHDYFTAADERGVRRAVTLFAKVKGLRVRANGEHWVLDPKPRD